MIPEKDFMYYITNKTHYEILNYHTLCMELYKELCILNWKIYYDFDNKIIKPNVYRVAKYILQKPEFRCQCDYSNIYVKQYVKQMLKEFGNQ